MTLPAEKQAAKKTAVPKMSH